MLQRKKERNVADSENQKLDERVHIGEERKKLQSETQQKEIKEQMDELNEENQRLKEEVKRLTANTIKELEKQRMEERIQYLEAEKAQVQYREKLDEVNKGNQGLKEELERMRESIRSVQSYCAMLEKENIIMLKILQEQNLNQEFQTRLQGKLPRPETVRLDVPYQSPLPVEFDEVNKQLVTKRIKSLAPSDYRRNIKEGDILSKVNSLKVTSLQMLSMAIEMLSDNERLALEFQRPTTLHCSDKAIISSRHENNSAMVKQIVVKVKNQQPIGIGVAKINGTLQISKCVQGRNLKMDSFLKVGDVLYEINGLKVYSPNMVKMAVEMLSSEDFLYLGIERKCNMKACCTDNESNKTDIFEGFELDGPS